MVNNVIVVIRSSGERTEVLCREIVAKQVPDNSIFVIHEKPFSKAVRKNFEIGIEQGKQWTLAVDADILLMEDAVKRIVEKAESLEDYFFLYQGTVLDRLWCAHRTGGPHLYRTEFLGEAIKYIPEEGSSLRPESDTYRKMAENGKHTFQGDELFGIHDYEQFYRDIFRTCFLHAKKHSYLASDLKVIWKRLEHKELDYRVALKGLENGINHTGDVLVDKDFYSEKSRVALSELGLMEKEEIDLQSVNSRDFVSKVLADYHPDRFTRKFQARELDFTYRTDRPSPEKKPSLGEKIRFKLRMIIRSVVGNSNTDEII